MNKILLPHSLLHSFLQVEFHNAVAGSNRSRFEVLSSGVVLLNRGEVGLFVLTPDGIMNELINTGKHII